MHFVKGVRIWSFSGPHFPAFGLSTEVYHQKNFEYGRFFGSNPNFFYDSIKLGKVNRGVLCCRNIDRTRLVNRHRLIAGPTFLSDCFVLN